MRSLGGRRDCLIYINTTQFGYHTDSLKHCQYLREDFDITYLCFDYGYEKLPMSKVKVHYVNWEGSYPVRGYRFIRTGLDMLKKHKEAYIFIVYFPMASLFKLLAQRKNMILDIRTGAVSGSRFAMKRFNKILAFESLFFSKVTIISDSLRRKLGISSSKTRIVPLGADVLSGSSKAFEELHLFYIGTLIGRRLYETVQGLGQFLSVFPNTGLNITYDIFGNGSKEDIFQLKNAIRETELQGVVKWHGRKNHGDILDYFDKCNVGVCYVPITEFYNCQPSTKIYEYVISGMACVATNTFENRKLINETNGVICSDTPAGFSEGLQRLVGKLADWDSVQIRNTLIDNTWENICIDLKGYILE